MRPKELRVSFEHWVCTLSGPELRKWGSPHFDRKTVGEAIGHVFATRGVKKAAGGMSVSRHLMAVCNHAYPEAAVVDPVADLELWEEWRLGIREFPYLGRYAPLGIFHQSGKTSSASSVGVIGEILAGRLAEALIAPTILVRVVRRWPDFILYSDIGRQEPAFAFVESKACGPDSGGRLTVCQGRIPGPQFGELAEQVVRQLNADPFIEIWGVFSVVREIAPYFTCDVTLVQFSAGDDRKAGSRTDTLPDVVLGGLAERSVGAALADMNDEQRMEFTGAPKRSEFRRHVERRLFEAASQHLSTIIQTELPRAAPVTPDDVEGPIHKALRRLPRDRYLPGLKTRDARRITKEHAVLFPVGSAGGQEIFMADLPETDRTSLHAQWTSDWTKAADPWDIQSGVELWRAGGALFALGDPSLEGKPVLPRSK